MGKITLSVRKDGTDMTKGAVAEFIPLQSGGKRFTSLVPVGGYQTSEISIETGNWLVQVRLPSGELLSREVTVSDTAPNEPVILRGRQSSHEWLAWANCVTDLQNPKTQQHRFFSFPDTWSVRGPHDDTFLPVRNTDQSWQDMQLILRERTRDGLVTDSCQYLDQNMVIPSQFHGAWYFDVIGDEEYRSVRISNPFYADMRGSVDRLVLGVQKMNPDVSCSQIAMIPLPWRERNAEEIDIQALITPCSTEATAGTDVKFGVQVLIQDQDIAPILAFLQNGNLEAASLLLKNLGEIAEGYLYNKIINPYAAAAGCYVLIRLREYWRMRDEGPQHNWTRNLADWFTWLPDGAIIYAWKRLFCDRDAPEDRLADARQYLQKAVDRGAPVFTEGVRLLRDATRLAFTKPDDTVTHGELLKRVRDLSNWAQPNTVFAIYHDDKPGLIDQIF